MNVELRECYERLDMSPGASPEELKVAYRDLAKVWHPDRFLHDPRLQEKAQEKLKEINEAYDQLRSGRAKGQTQRPTSANQRRTPPTSEHFDRYARENVRTGNVAVIERTRWQLILAPVLVFAMVFLATYRSLLRPNEQEHQRQVPTIEQPQAVLNPERQQPGSRDTDANELQHGSDRIKSKSQREETAIAPLIPAGAAPLRPLPTVTVEIDPYTGMIAGPDCKVRSRMTYPAGNEPRQLCNARHPGKASAADVSGTRDSRLRSVAKRLAPGKWFGDKAKPDAGSKQEP